MPWIEVAAPFWAEADGLALVLAPAVDTFAPVAVYGYFCIDAAFNCLTFLFGVSFLVLLALTAAAEAYLV